MSPTSLRLSRQSERKRASPGKKGDGGKGEGRSVKDPKIGHNASASPLPFTYKVSYRVRPLSSSPDANFGGDEPNFSSLPDYLEPLIRKTLLQCRRSRWTTDMPDRKTKNRFFVRSMASQMISVVPCDHA